MKKSEIRHIYKERRKGLTSSQILKLDDLMLIQFQQLPIQIPAVIMTYAPIERWNEFDPQLITDYCYFKNPFQQLYYPLVTEIEGASIMLPVLVNDETEFEKNELGFIQPIAGIDISPEDIDMIIVPLLAFDKKGYRVGYGKGYYDRFLKQCKPDAIKIGFSYFVPVENIADANQFDIPLNYCITHDTIYSF
jgi:5-formyltetrahydrofolate cyclo-ligase